MPKVVGLIGPALSFYGDLLLHKCEWPLFSSQLKHHSLCKSSQSQARSAVFPITCSQSILYFAFIALFKICNSLGDNHLFHKQSSLRIETMSFLPSLFP